MRSPNHFRPVFLALTITLAGVVHIPGQARETQPVAPLVPVIEQYFGTEVTDNYRYMENLADPHVQAWMQAQAGFTNNALEQLPGRAALLARIHSLSNATISRRSFVRRGERYFYQLAMPGAQVAKLYYRDGLQGEEHLLLDPATLAKDSRSHYSLDYYMPSWDGKKIAYGLSIGGSEQSVMHVLEVSSGKILAENIDRTANSVIAWRPDNRSFFYLRYNKATPLTPATETAYNARTYLHLVGANPDGNGDAVVFGRGVSRQVDVPEGQGTYIEVMPTSGYAIAVANHNMDDNPATLFVARLDQINGPATPWRKVADVKDGVTQFVMSADKLVFLSQKDASRFRLLSTSLARPDVARAQVIVAEGPGVLTHVALAREGLYVRERTGAVAHILSVSLDGKKKRQIPELFDGNIRALITDPLQSGVLFNTQSTVNSPVMASFDPALNAVADTGLIPQSSIDSTQIETREVFALSHDGTRIPLSITYKKGLKLDGSHPTILSGYGAYGISMESTFNPVSLAWIERGGVLAVAHIRGGGEYGEAWHDGGRKLTKLNTIFDFIACGQYLVDHRYTSPKYLAGQGGSAGGITVGGALTWRPDLFGVILDLVGMSDTLRFETEPNGPPNVPEFGSVSTEEGFHGLYAMGAYFHVRDGTSYPAVMFATGVNDPRVSSWHMTKMAARVQAATSSARPVLLRIDYHAGHGIGSTVSQRELMTADLWSFALWQMGDPAFQPIQNP